MTASRARRGIPALPDLVFNTAADPARVAAWLPPPLHVVGRSDDVVIVRRDGEQRQIRVSVDQEALELTWQPLADQGCRGALRVDLAGVAGSVAELSLDCPGADAGLAARMLEALAAEVEQNLTDG